MMVVDLKTGKKANSKTKTGIIESFKTNDNKSNSFLNKLEGGLYNTNILKFY